MEHQMTVAMRVIQSAAIREAATPEDVELLRAWATPDDRHHTPAELACIIIDADLRRRIMPEEERAAKTQAAAASG
jgi:hypothetical protein